jgi:hypothetical protein
MKPDCKFHYPEKWDEDDDLGPVPYRVRDRSSRAKRAGKKLRFRKCKR